VALLAVGAAVSVGAVAQPASRLMVASMATRTCHTRLVLV
jgi:hypothetical protein